MRQGTLPAYLSPIGRRDRRLLWSLILTLIALGINKPLFADGDTAPATPTPPALLPAGFLSAHGSQIVGPDGIPVRIACVGLTGMNVVGGRLELEGPFKGIEGHVAAMKAMGFNCVRVDWIDKTLDDPGAMAQLDQFVAACKKVGLKVIFDNHNNEATPAESASTGRRPLRFHPAAAEKLAQGVRYRLRNTSDRPSIAS
jgi:hypothetical protein